MKLATGKSPKRREKTLSSKINVELIWINVIWLSPWQVCFVTGRPAASVVVLLLMGRLWVRRNVERYGAWERNGI
jgi:hypothetical protein